MLIQELHSVAGLRTDIPTVGPIPLSWGNAIQQAYELDTCKGRNLPADCNVDLDYVVLVLAYNSGQYTPSIIDFFGSSELQSKRTCARMVR